MIQITLSIVSKTLDTSIGSFTNVSISNAIKTYIDRTIINIFEKHKSSFLLSLTILRFTH